MVVKNPYLKSCFFLAYLAAAGACHSDIVVVGSLDAPELSPTAAKQIFLKKTNTLPNGIAATPIDLSDNNEIKWAFYKQIAGKDAAQIYSYWSRAVFTGAGNPPDQVNTAEELKRRLNKDAGVIGYIDEKDLQPGMKVLLRIAASE